MAALTAAVPPPAAAAVVLPVEAAAVAAGAAPAAAAAAAARPAATNWKNVRVKWAKALLLLACAAAALALFAMSTADSGRVLGACAPTDAEAAALRAASEQLLLAAAAQVLGATTAVLLPVTLVTIFSTLLGWMTGYLASQVMWMLVACHGRVDAVLAIYYWLFVAMLCAAYLVGCFLHV